MLRRQQCGSCYPRKNSTRIKNLNVKPKSTIRSIEGERFYSLRTGMTSLNMIKLRGHKWRWLINLTSQKYKFYSWPKDFLEIAIGYFWTPQTLKFMWKRKYAKIFILQYWRANNGLGEIFSTHILGKSKFPLKYKLRKSITEINTPPQPQNKQRINQIIPRKGNTT